MAEQRADSYMDQIRAVIQVCEDTDGILIVDRDGIIRDHRIAMSGAVALTASQDGGEILDADCVAISFPDFYTLLNKGGISC